MYYRLLRRQFQPQKGLVVIHTQNAVKLTVGVFLPKGIHRIRSLCLDMRRAQGPQSRNKNGVFFDSKFAVIARERIEGTYCNTRFFIPNFSSAAAKSFPVRTMRCLVKIRGKSFIAKCSLTKAQRSGPLTNIISALSP